MDIYGIIVNRKFKIDGSVVNKFLIYFLNFKCNLLLNKFKLILLNKIVY